MPRTLAHRAGWCAVPANRSRDLLSAVQTRLATIRIANGYRTDIGASITLERITALAKDGVPRIGLGIEQLRVDRRFSDQRTRDYQVSVEAMLPADMSNAEAIALDALEDIVDLFPDVTRLTLPDDVVADVQLDIGRVLVRPQGLPVTAAQVTLTASVQERT